MKFTITQKELKNLAACCANKHRSQLQNIFLSIKEGRAELAATNGTILAVIRKDAELENDTQKDLKTCVTSELYKKFNSKAHVEISSTDKEGVFRAYDLISGAEIFYTAPINPARPNYEIILNEIKTAKTAEDYAIFAPDILTKINAFFGPFVFNFMIPITTYKNKPHFWVDDDIIIAAMPCRA